jgi:hypothetical protein
MPASRAFPARQDRRIAMSTEGRDKPMTFPESEGEGTDGQGSPGIIEEKNRDAEEAQADNSAFDLDGDDTDGAGSTGILDEQTRQERVGTDGKDSDGAGSGGILDDRPESGR